ncbi:MAG TPA: hypothetical protein PL029_09240, partial [Bacteroidia bacterium]|nr:hypothetical protein [Bacteroidia bacterium]
MQKTGLVPVILLVLLAINLSNAQSSRAAHWYFGIQAGLNFMSGTAVADTTSQIASIEGSAAMSDSIGNLLFYAGGDKVWNKNGILMANSNGMLGDVSSAQSGIIVPKPGSNSLYYLFNTIPYSLNGGLYYNVIDMSLNNGLGDINASKNILLFSSCSEEIAATRHCNAMDYWIVSRETTNGSLKFYAYRLSSTGLSAPVISTFPLAISDWAAVGGLTFSQNGNLLIHNATGAGSIQVLNFDKQTGQLTQQTQVSVYPNEQVYS